MSLPEAAGPARPGRDRWSLAALSAHPVTVVALAAAVVGATAHFTTRSWFSYDDFVYFSDAQRKGLSFSLLTSPLNVHFSPGHRVVDWVLQRYFPLDFGLTQVFFLLCLGATVLVLHRLLTELFGPGPGPLLLTALFGTSIINVGAVQYWASGLQTLPTGVLSLLAMLAWLRYRRTADRRMLVVAVAALSIGLVFYIKPLLVVFYLALIEVLVLEPERPIREKLGALRRDWRVWVPLLAPVGAYVVVYLARYWEPSHLPSLDVVGQFLRTAWARVFAANFAGVHPRSTAHDSDGAVLVVQLVMVALVAASLVRSRRAWRAWAFFAVAFLANALLVGLPRLSDFGVGVGYQLRYYPELNWLFPIAVGAAFLGVPSERPRPTAALKGLVAGGLAVALVVHLVVAWSGARRIAAESPGSTTRAFLAQVRSGLGPVTDSPDRASLVDGRFPQFVLGVPAPFGYRYSEVLRLVDHRIAFDRSDRELYRVSDDGTVNRLWFTSVTGGDAGQLLDGGVLSAPAGSTERHGSQVCVGSPASATSVDFTPRAPLRGSGWFVDLRYSSPTHQTLPLFVDRGQGYPYLDRAVTLQDTTGAGALADLGGPGVVRVRIDVPAGSRVCLARLDLGHLAPDAAGAPPRPLADSFERPDHRFGIGTAPGGPRWRAEVGAWGVSGAAAYVSGPPDARALAVADVGGGDGSVSAKVARVANGAGLVFRYRDRDDWWAVVAVPAYATWVVVRTVDGHSETVANTGVSPVGDGTVISVRTAGDTIEIGFDRGVAKTLVDPALRDAGGAGITAEGADAGRARFDDFSFSPPAPRQP